MAENKVTLGQMGEEDIKFGKSTFNQTRYGSLVARNELRIQKDVENIAALRLLDGDTFVEAQVMGNSTINDGKGGLYYFDAAAVEADDGRTIIKPTAITTGRWKLVNNDKTTYVSTVTDMLDYDYESGFIGQLIVKGYSFINDGGGGIFNWDSTVNKNTANAGTIFDPSVSLALQGTGVGTGCWVRQYSGAIDVRWFGAKVDGATNDTTAIDLAATVGEIRIDSGIAVSSSITQTLYVGNGVVKNPDTSINYYFIRKASLATDTDKNARILSGAIRQNTDSSGWYYIDDASHSPHGFDIGTAITVDGSGDIVVGYNFTASTTGSLSVTTDESFASLNIMTGASVSTTGATIKLYKDLEGGVNNATAAVSTNAYFGSSVTAVDNGDGTITVTHPTVNTTTHLPILTDSTNGFKTAIVHSSDATSFTYGTYAPFQGYIYYDGAAWQVLTGAKNKPTMVFAGNVLTVTHEALDSSNAYVVATARSGANVVQMDGVTATTFTIVFRDFAGAVLTTPTTAMRFYYSGGHPVLAETPTGTTNFKRTACKLNANNVFGTTSNLWLNGFMEV